MTKELAHGIILNCAKLYRDNLVNRNILFVFGYENRPEYFEVVCLPQNFKHLVGVDVAKRYRDSVAFYDACLSEKLEADHIDIKKDGTTRMKINVLRQAMQIHTAARMVGDYSGNKIRLETEKIAGNQSACVGFKSAKQSPPFFVPNTVLQDNVKTVVEKPARRILAIFRKPKDDKFYRECTYKAKNVSLEMVLENESRLKNKIQLIAN